MFFAIGGGDRGRGDFSVDLKLGQVVNGKTECAKKWSEIKFTATYLIKFNGKTDGALTAACFVDGYISDLNIYRDHHRQDKVYELHSKTPQVFIGGQKQRFHCLEEFDEGKRSCRKRLDRHNRRRRKPQLESVPGPANILSNYQGTQLLSFFGIYAFESSHTAVHNWPVLELEPEPKFLLYNQQLIVLDKHNLCLGSPSYPDGKILQFQAPASQLFLRNRAFMGSDGDKTKTLNDKISTAVYESDCALSPVIASVSECDLSSQQQSAPWAAGQAWLAGSSGSQAGLAGPLIRLASRVRGPAHRAQARRAREP